MIQPARATALHPRPARPVRSRQSSSLYDKSFPRSFRRTLVHADRPSGSRRGDEHPNAPDRGSIDWNADESSSASADGSSAETRSKGLGPLVQRLSATYSKSEPHYLAIKNRSKWWKRGTFPRTPHDSLDDPKIAQQPVKLWKKVVPLALIFFLSSFNLTILQALKDAIVVTTSGAEALPFLASFVVLPASVAFFAYYSKIVNVMPKQAVYYLAIIPFVVFYGLFAAFVYPVSDSLHFHGLFNKVAPHVPIGLHGLIKVVENWTFSLFFCFAELWGSVVIAVLFWTLANDVCTVDEAKTVYPMMGISANIALVAAGNYMKVVSATVLKGATTQAFLQTMVATIVAASVAMAAVKVYIDQGILKQKDAADEAADAASASPTKKKKAKGSWKDTMETLRASPKIMNLALLVVCYALSHRLFEFAWKGQLRVLFPTAQAYSGALADVSIYTGYMTILLMLTGKFVFEYLGWGTAALATPAVMLVAGAAFFGLSLAAMSLGASSSAALLTAGALAGAVTQVFARSSKFSLFDPAKEMVYIEMTKEEKSKGKAAVDLMGSQAGKSGASWIIQGALLVLGSATACLPVLATVYVAVIATWARAALSLKGLMAETEAARVEGDDGTNSNGGGAENGAGGGAVSAATAAGTPAPAAS